MQTPSTMLATPSPDKCMCKQGFGAVAEKAKSKYARQFSANRGKVMFESSSSDNEDGMGADERKILGLKGISK